MVARRKAGDVRSASPRDARAYASKAHEYLHAAQTSLEVGNNVAAVGNAVHAGIAAADAVAAALSGAVWRGEHGQSPDHLEKAGSDGRQAARQLRRLIPLKTSAEYDPDPLSAAQARAALQAAERLVAIADRLNPRSE